MLQKAEKFHFLNLKCERHTVVFLNGLQRNCAGSMKYPCSFNYSPSKETDLFISGWWWEQSLSPPGRTALSRAQTEERTLACLTCFVSAAFKTTVRYCDTSKAWLVKYDHCSLYSIHIFLYKCFNNQLFHLQPGLFFSCLALWLQKAENTKKRIFFFSTCFTLEISFLTSLTKNTTFFLCSA